MLALAVSQNAAYQALDSVALSSLNSASLRAVGSSSSISPCQIVAEPQPAVGQATTCNISQEGAGFNTTDEATNEAEAADYSQMAAHHSQMVIIPSMQQHHLLSLLEQGLSILTPNNLTSALFAAAAEFIPFSVWYSQRWKVAYEHESLCKLHTAYNHPGRFGTKGLQKVDVFTNSKTTLQISVLLNHITSGLDEEKKSYG